MRTTLNIDDEALADALQMAPGKTKTEVINEALRDHARRQRLARELVKNGAANWGGGKPEGSADPPKVRGKTASEMVLEDRR